MDEVTTVAYPLNAEHDYFFVFLSVLHKKLKNVGYASAKWKSTVRRILLRYAKCNVYIPKFEHLFNGFN